MAKTGEYVGCRVIVYDAETHAELTRTQIVDYDRIKYNIAVDRFAFADEPPERVTVLIFCNNELHEYSGTAYKSLYSNRQEIGLYKGKVLENRAETRYPVNAQVTVKNLLVARKPIPMRHPATVELVNLSGKGCLLRGNVLLFNIGTAMQLEIPMDGNFSMLNVTIVRIKRVGMQTFEYGCLLRF